MSKPERIARADDVDLFQIGKVAERVGLSLRTVRYYEEVGLFRPTGRSQGGFRLFAEEDVQRLLILKGMQPLGLALEEIRELMDLFDRSVELERLKATEVETLAAGLQRYAELADERVRKLEQHLEEARRLRSRIHTRLRDCKKSSRRK